MYRYSHYREPQCLRLEWKLHQWMMKMGSLRLSIFAGLLSKQHSSYLTLHSTPCLYGSSPAFEVVILRRSIQPGYENVCTGQLIGMLHDRSTTRTYHYYIVCWGSGGAYKTYEIPRRLFMHFWLDSQSITTLCRGIDHKRYSFRPFLRFAPHLLPLFTISSFIFLWLERTCCFNRD